MAVTSDQEAMSESKKKHSKRNKQPIEDPLPKTILDSIPPGFRKVQFCNLQASKCYENRTLTGIIWKTYPIIKRKDGYLRKLLVTDVHDFEDEVKKKLTVFLFDKFAQDSEPAQQEGFILIVNFITENLTSKSPQDDETLFPLQVLVMNADSHVWFARKVAVTPVIEPETRPAIAITDNDVKVTNKENHSSSSKKNKKDIPKESTTTTERSKLKKHGDELATPNCSDNSNENSDKDPLPSTKAKKTSKQKPSTSSRAKHQVAPLNENKDVADVASDSQSQRRKKTPRKHVNFSKQKDKKVVANDDDDDIHISSMESPVKKSNVQHQPPKKVTPPKVINTDDLSPSKKSPYTYHLLSELKETPPDQHWHVYGILTQCNLKVIQGNSNRILDLVLTDQTDVEFTCSVYGGKEDVFPDVHPGDIVRIHRIQVFKFRGKLKGKCFDTRFLLVFSKENNVVIPKSVAKSFTFAEEDKTRVNELFQYADKKSEPKLICEIRKGDSVNLICQVISVYIAKTTDCVVMKVWDGTKTTEFESQHKGLPGEKMDQELYTVARNYYVNLFVFGSYCYSAGELNPGDFIEVRDAHLYVSKQEPYEATLRIQDAQKEDRGVRLLDTDNELVIILKERLDRIFGDVREFGNSQSQPELTLGESDSFFLNCDVSAFNSQNLAKEGPKEASPVASSAAKSRTPRRSTRQSPQKNKNVDHPKPPEESTNLNSLPQSNIVNQPKESEKRTHSLKVVPDRDELDSSEETSSLPAVKNTAVTIHSGVFQMPDAVTSPRKKTTKHATTISSPKTKRLRDQSLPGTSKDTASSYSDNERAFEPQPGTSKDPVVPLPQNYVRAAVNQPGPSYQSENIEPTQSDFIIPTEVQNSSKALSTQENQIISVLTAGVKHGQSTQGFGEGIARFGLQPPNSDAAPDPSAQPASNATFLEDRMLLMENPTQYPTQFNYQSLRLNFPSATPDEWWKSVPAASETIGHNAVKPTSLSTVVRHDVPYKFRIYAIVLNFKPDSTLINSFIRLYCPSCNFLSEDADPTFESFATIDDLPFFHCPECLRNYGSKMVLEYTYLITFSLHDGTDPAFIEASIWRQNAISFFKGITPEEALRDNSAAEAVFEMLWTVCPNCRPIDVVSLVDNPDWRNYPTLDCCIFSYTAGGMTRYQLFDTKLI